MKTTLDELSIAEVETTASFLKEILMDINYQQGNLHTCFVDERISSFRLESEGLEDVAVVSAAPASYLLIRREGAAVIQSRSRNQLSLWKVVGRSCFSDGALKWIR